MIEYSPGLSGERSFQNEDNFMLKKISEIQICLPSRDFSGMSLCSLSCHPWSNLFSMKVQERLWIRPHLISPPFQMVTMRLPLPE